MSVINQVAKMAVSTPILSSTIYESAINVPPYGRLLQVGCIFFNLLNKDNQKILKEFVDDNFSSENSQAFGNFIILCNNEHNVDKIIEIIREYKHNELLIALFTKLEIDIDNVSLDSFTNTLNTKFSSIIKFIEEKKDQIENENGLSEITKIIPKSGGRRSSRRQTKKMKSKKMKSKKMKSKKMKSRRE